MTPSSRPASGQVSEPTGVPEPDQLEDGDALAGRIAGRFAEGGSTLMHEFDLRITHAEPGRVRFTLPVAERLTHSGGVLSGQAILACMDTGMVFVMMSLNPEDDAMFFTVQLQTSFERGVPADIGEVEFEARATKPGRTVVFGEIELFLPSGQRAAHATTTYMWIPAVTS